MMMQLRGREAAATAGEGERIEERRRRRKYWIIGGSFTVGLAAGVTVGLHEGEDLFAMPVSWPPAMAIGLAFAYVVAVIGGGLAMARHTDEVERQVQYKAVAFAALLYALVYPVWLCLWFGGLVPEPMHGALFLVFWFGMIAGSLFYKFR